MATANIRDRASIERIYPPEAYAADAAHNDRHKQPLVKGVRIFSGPDAQGDFTIDRASRQVGETDATGFLAPFHRATAEEDAAADPDPRHGYGAFIDDIIMAAKAGFRPEAAPGAGDPRLRGPRQ